jgi:hypothetical protein
VCACFCCFELLFIFVLCMSVKIPLGLVLYCYFNMPTIDKTFILSYLILMCLSGAACLPFSTMVWKKTYYYYFIKCKLFSSWQLGPSWPWSSGSWILNYLWNQWLSPLTLWVRILHRRGVLDTTLCDKVCQWLATGRWFSPGILRFPQPINLIVTI